MTKIESASDDANASGGAHNAIPRIVTVGEILDRRVPLQWYESVAIVAGLCSRLAETGATAMPAPANIVLSPEGAIFVTGDSGRHNLVALPRLLHELLSVTTHPTPLRLLVLHTISTEGDKSPKTFGSALAYYERPGREALIQSARNRFFDAPVASIEPGQPKPSEMLDAEPEPISAPAVAAPIRRTPAIAAAIVATVALTAVTVSQARTGHPNIVTRSWRTVQTMAAQVADAGRTIAQAVGAQPKPATSDAKPAAETSPAAERSKSHSHKGTTQIARVNKSGSDKSGGDKSGETAVAASPLDSRIEPEATMTAAATPVQALEVGATTNTGATDTEMRSDYGDGIVPPRLLDPVRLPSWAQPADLSSTNIIELDIAATGTVKRVRLVSPPTRLTDMMILSAAKTWVFAPASAGGRPVPYRLTLNWVPPNR